MSETDACTIKRWSAVEEGQFFERKSAFDRKSGEPKARKAVDITWDVVETLSAMANADGGELVIGLEDDGVPTGIPLAEDRLNLILGSPKDRNYVTPPLPCKSAVKTTGDGKRVLYFEVDWSPNVHLLADSRCLLRVRDRNEPIYDRATLDWLRHFDTIELTGDQKRMLAYAHAHGDQFTSREFQKVIETDIYGASNAIKDMIRKGVVCSTAKGSRVYEVRELLRLGSEAPSMLASLLPLLQRNGSISNSDVRRVLHVSRNTAARTLSELVAGEWLKTSGKRGQGAKYMPGRRLLHQSPIAPNAFEGGAIGSEDGAMTRKE